MTVPKEIIIDFETRSSCDIARGVDSYATDKDADILCMIAIERAPYAIAKHFTPHKQSADLIDILESADIIWAHNARFDQGIWEYIAAGKYGFPEKRADQWKCSSHLARLNGLPAALDKAGRALNLTNQKQTHAGKALIRKLCIPNKLGQFHESVEDTQALLSYCVDDVLTTRDLINACYAMTEQAHKDWLENEAINDRGIGLDLTFAAVAAQYVDKEKLEISHELSQLTSGAITSPQQHQRFPKYVLKHAPQAEPYLKKYDKGEVKMSMDKEHLGNLIDAVDSNVIDLPDNVYNALQCKAEAGGAATAKFNRMLMKADDDGRVRGEFICFGASTGRYTSRGIQLHNFKRDCFSVPDAERLRSTMMTGMQLSGAVIPTLGKMLRPTIVPAEGKIFIVGDWSQIENRALPFLAESPLADKKIALFRQIDADPSLDDTYVVAAKSAGLDDRQIGKVIELSLGYLGGAGAFNSMAKNYGVNLPLYQVEMIIDRWRIANRWAVKFGAQVERAAMLAIRNSPATFPAGLVSYTFDPDTLGGALLCRLPCGTQLVYAHARVEKNKYGFGVTAMKANIVPKADDKEWPRYSLWKGLLLENITQAFCASLLRDLLTRLDDVILHCHDEVVQEVDTTGASLAAYNLQHEMEKAPTWAQGLPLKAEPAVMSRYGKA